MIKVAIVYPTDPFGDIPGGTDTCIRDILIHSPDDISIKLIGVSTDPIARPINTLTRCYLGHSSFEFFPVAAFESLGKQMRIPLSVRFGLSLFGKTSANDADIVQFHRIEPALLYYRQRVPKVYFIHQNMNILHNKNSDIRWKYFPQAYFALENLLLTKASVTYAVRRDAVEEYRQRYSELADRFRFLPTWLNPNLFFPTTKMDNDIVRSAIVKKYGWRYEDHIFISVGRIDHQKNPLLQIDALALLKNRMPNTRLVMVGDGALRAHIEKRIAELHLSDSVHIAGVLGPEEVANLLRTFDTMILSSAYEGMPRCVLEALGCGMPVVTTNVGEVTRVVHHKQNGIVVSNHTKELFADAMEKAILNHESFAGQPCLDAIQEYMAPIVLRDVYKTYRVLAKPL